LGGKSESVGIFEAIATWLNPDQLHITKFGGGVL
jgi:hypothetical protein